jgi:hypothetical protein
MLHLEHNRSLNSHQAQLNSSACLLSIRVSHFTPSYSDGLLNISDRFTISPRYCYQLVFIVEVSFIYLLSSFWSIRQSLCHILLGGELTHCPFYVFRLRYRLTVLTQCYERSEVFRDFNGSRDNQSHFIAVCQSFGGNKCANLAQWTTWIDVLNSNNTFDNLI